MKHLQAQLVRFLNVEGFEVAINPKHVAYIAEHPPTPDVGVPTCTVSCAGIEHRLCGTFKAITEALEQDAYGHLVGRMGS